MEFLTALWLPILLSGVALFFASFVAWTMMPHHKSDWKSVPAEDELMSALRKLNLPPGNYIFPSMTHSDCKNPEAMQKFNQGPRGILGLWDLPNMGVNMFCTFVFFLITAAIIAYACFTALGPGKDFLTVFRIAGTIGILTYAAGGIPNGIWFKRRMITDVLDGIVYGLILGLIFGLLWPSA